MKNSIIPKLTLSALLILSISIAKGQVEYRVGLGLYEMTELSFQFGRSYPMGSFFTHQVANSYLLERQNNRITHRLTARYINFEHSLKNRDLRPDLGLDYNGEFKRTEWDVGYNFLYSFGKQKRLSTGLGLAYLEDHQISGISMNEYLDISNKAVVPTFLIEGNIKVAESWYISPSFQYMLPYYFKSSDSGNEIHSKVNLPKSTFYITYLKLSVKRNILSKD